MISRSVISFSKEIARPPSIHPAPWINIVAPARNAPHAPIWVSLAACASLMLPDAPVEFRHGNPIRRANCPAPRFALTCSGVPNAGAPDFMSTFEAKAP